MSYTSRSSQFAVAHTPCTLGTRSSAEAPATDLWFQLYVSKDRGRSSELIQRAAASGYTTLVLTVILIPDLRSGRRQDLEALASKLRAAKLFRYVRVDTRAPPKPRNHRPNGSRGASGGESDAGAAK